MRKVQINNSVYEVPGSWADLSKKQLLFLINLSSQDNLTSAEIQLKLLLYCMKAQVLLPVTDNLFLIKTKKENHYISPEEMSSLLFLFNFLFTEDDTGTKVLTPGFMPNHFEKIKIGRKHLYGPSAGLDNLTYNQFVWLQTYQSQLRFNPKSIDSIIATIYKTKSGKSNARLTARVPAEVKTAILWFVIGSLSFIENTFPHVFQSGRTGESVNVFDQQQRIIDSLADGDVTKKDRVRESLLYDALYSMEMAAIKQEEIEKKLKTK